ITLTFEKVCCKEGEKGDGLRRLTADIFDDGVISRRSLTYRVVEASFAIAGIGAMVLNTEPHLSAKWSDICLTVDIVVLAFFILDWLARLWVVPLSVDGLSPWRARTRWLTSRTSIIGLLS